MSPASPARMPPLSCVGQLTPCSTPRLRAHQEPGGRGRAVDPALRRRPERGCVASSPSRPTRRSVPSEVPNRVNRTTVTTGQSTGVWWRWAPTGVRARIRGLAPDLDRASRPSTSADPHDWRDLQPASEEHGQPVPVASRPECGLLQGRRDGPRLPTSDETGVALRDARRLGQTGQVGSRSRRAVIRRWHQAAVTN